MGRISRGRRLHHCFDTISDLVEEKGELGKQREFGNERLLEFFVYLSK